MNALLQLHHGLATALQADPLHQLALLTVTLDPLWQADVDELYEQDGGIELGLLIAREVFPEVYAEAILLRHAGASDTQIETALCEGFTRCGIPLDDLVWLGYGIPLVAAGVNLNEPDFYSNADFAAIMALFGVQPTEDSYGVDIPDVVYSAGYLLASSLTQQSDPQWQQVGWLLAWCFGCSGNTLVDLDDESLCEIQPLNWDKEDVAFAIDLIAETEQILTDAHAGLHWLMTTAAYDCLATNIQHTFKGISKHKGKSDAIKVLLKWSPIRPEKEFSTVLSHHSLSHHVPTEDFAHQH
jgi:hypothetical protein